MNTFKQAMLRALEEGQSLYRIANHGCVSMDEAMKFLKASYPAMNDDQQDAFGDLEFEYVPVFEKGPEDMCHAYDAKEFRDGL